MELPKQITDALAPFGGSPHFLCVTGSKMYGTNRADSDTDYRGFVETTAPYLLGRQKFEQAEINNDSHDIVIYSFQKFLWLVSSGSTNAVELLFVPENLIIKTCPSYELLRQHRAAFITQDMVYRVICFAKASWKRCNEERATKQAYHAIRLLIQSYGLLRYQNIKFPLEECQRIMLREIRDAVFDESFVRNTFAVYQSFLLLVEEEFAKGTLPKKIDQSLVDNLYYDVIQGELSRFTNERRV